MLRHFDRSESSWFRSAGGRRFGIEIGLIVLIKFAALTALHYIVIAPQPHADTSPAAIQRHLLDTAVNATQTTGDRHD